MRIVSIFTALALAGCVEGVPTENINTPAMVQLNRACMAGNMSACAEVERLSVARQQANGQRQAANAAAFRAAYQPTYLDPGMFMNQRNANQSQCTYRGYGNTVYQNCY